MARKKKRGKVIKLQPKMSLPKYIKQAGRKLDLHEVLWTKDTLEYGKGHVFVSRKKRNGDIILGRYKVDLYCLGVSDTIYRILSPSEYLDYMDFVGSTHFADIVDVDPSIAYNLIYGAVEYAEDLGIDPHEDFSITEHLLDPVEDIEYIDIEFGLDGKPCYYYYTGDKKAEIIKKLEAAVGPDGYTFVDGESIFDEKDSDIEGDDFDDLINFAAMRFPDESGMLEYLAYAGIVTLIEQMYDDNIDEMERLLTEDRDTLLHQVLLQISDVEAEGTFLMSLIFGVAENYVIHEDADYLIYGKEYLLAFDKNHVSAVPTYVAKIDVFEFGKDKIFNLVQFLANYRDDLDFRSFDITKFKSLMNQFELEDLFVDYPTELAFDALVAHQDHFGDIDFTSFDWSKMQRVLPLSHS